MKNSPSAYDLALEPSPANYVPLTPLTFLSRTAGIYPSRTAIIYGDVCYTWSETYARCVRFAAALRAAGVEVGDTVAVLAPNTPVLFEAHFGVPMAGAVLNAVNIRLDAESIAFMLEHGGAKVLIADLEFADVVQKVMKRLGNPPRLITVRDFARQEDLLGGQDYEAFLSEGSVDYDWKGPDDEWQALALNYTSGTTGNPKGVVYHHRGAYLNAVSNALSWNMPLHPVYLWTLPMFHCNGWCFPWTVTALAGTHVCLRAVEARIIFSSIAEHRVTHLCGAPVVLNMLLNADESMRQRFSHTVHVATGGAAPPETVIEGIEALGMKIAHLYGLTETYGPATLCAWHPDWDRESIADRAGRMARQGVRTYMQEDVQVADPDTLAPVPRDDRTIGEIMIRGNTVMKGYLKNPEATQAAFTGGWFHTGDLGVWDGNGYVRIKDRAKDIIISGGENISTIEVESVLYRHPEVLEAAVVARPDDYWGETPCAFVSLKSSTASVDAAAIIAFCRERLAGFKVPKTIIFGPLPKTSTGKIQKFLLRERAKEL